MSTVPTEDYEDQPKGVWSRWKERLFGEYEDIDDDDYEEATPSRGSTIKIQPARRNKVSVWMNITKEDEVRSAADGLVRGYQQIINLEGAQEDFCRKVLDFLDGVVYALGGDKERVGARVFLYAPAGTTIDTDGSKASSQMGDLFTSN